jgi:hypothetical protein
MNSPVDIVMVWNAKSAMRSPRRDVEALARFFADEFVGVTPMSSEGNEGRATRSDRLIRLRARVRCPEQFLFESLGFIEREMARASAVANCPACERGSEMTRARIADGACRRRDGYAAGRPNRWADGEADGAWERRTDAPEFADGQGSCGAG